MAFYEHSLITGVKGFTAFDPGGEITFCLNFNHFVCVMAFAKVSKQTTGPMMPQHSA
jgi:hypothetical protein